MSEITITELIDSKTLQLIQDTFSKLTGLAAIITDPNGVPITDGSGFTEFCMKYTRCSELGLKRCMECDKNGAMETLAMGRPYIYKCHVGLYDFAAPIMVGKNVIGCIIGGQAVCSELDAEKLRVSARELGIDEQAYVEAAKKIDLHDMETVKNYAECLFELANAISSMSYSNYLSIKKIEETEHSMQLLSNHVAKNFVDDLKICIDGWMDRVNSLFDEYDCKNREEIKNAVLAEGEKVYSKIEKNIDSKKRELSMNSKYSERLYNIKNLMVSLSAEADDICRNRGIKFNYHIDENISDVFFGDDESIGFIIDFILADFINNTESNMINLEIASDEHGYSENVNITFLDENTIISPERIDEIMNCFKNYNYSYENKSFDKADYTFIGFLLKNMSGEIKIVSDDKTGTVFKVTIPQLKVKE